MSDLSVVQAMFVILIVSATATAGCLEAVESEISAEINWDEDLIYVDDTLRRGCNCNQSMAN